MQDSSWQIVKSASLMSKIHLAHDAAAPVQQRLVSSAATMFPPLQISAKLHVEPPREEHVPGRGGHAEHTVPPQSTPVSSWFWMLSEQVGGATHPSSTVP